MSGTSPEGNSMETPGNTAEGTEGNQSVDQKPWQFKPGQSGNPLGRPKGSRNRFCKAMLDDFTEVWREGGKAALTQMRDEKPNEFVRAALHWVPEQYDIGDNTQTAFRQLWEAWTTGKLPTLKPEDDEENG